MRQNKLVVFDLDDTLFKEIDYLKSAYGEISSFIGHKDAFGLMLNSYHSGGNPFQTVIDSYSLPYTTQDLLTIYRQHKPNIVLDNAAEQLLSHLQSLDIAMGLITDGRSLQQRNKIKALHLNRYINNDNILISEEKGYGKPDERLYLYFMTTFPNASYYYIGDNLKKDFITPNALGWHTIALLDDGRNIHSQQVIVEDNYLPQQRIASLEELIPFFD